MNDHVPDGTAGGADDPATDPATDPAASSLGPAAERWAALLAGWAVPDDVLAGAPESPWVHDVSRFAAGGPGAGAIASTGWAREVLPPMGATVLDVGCGGGRAALALVPPATELIGVDRSGAMLDAFVAAAEGAGVARRTVHGAWPDVAPSTPHADVVVCRNVLFDVADIAPFLVALTDHARLAVVVEIPTRHPMSAWAPAWQHFWGVDRPAGPDDLDLLAVVRELGLDPEHTRVVPPPRPPDDPATLVVTARRRLCLPPERDGELAAWLADHPPVWPETVAILRWPGEAVPG